MRGSLQLEEVVYYFSFTCRLLHFGKGVDNVFWNTLPYSWYKESLHIQAYLLYTGYTLISHLLSTYTHVDITWDIPICSSLSSKIGIILPSWVGPTLSKKFPPVLKCNEEQEACRHDVRTNTVHHASPTRSTFYKKAIIQFTQNQPTKKFYRYSTVIPSKVQ